MTEDEFKKVVERFHKFLTEVQKRSLEETIKTIDMGAPHYSTIMNQVPQPKKEVETSNHAKFVVWDTLRELGLEK